jgi:exo-1,4-beta-D-glucosaminidase
VLRFKMGLAAVVALAAGALCSTTAGVASAHSWNVDAGRSSLVSGWAIQSSAVVRHSGAETSRPGYSTKGWLALSQPETLMAGLLENGRYPNVFYSDNLAKVPTDQFDVNWWYRNQFTLHQRRGQHTFLMMNGVVGSASLWINGVKIADQAQLQGSYSQLEYDITKHVRSGANAIALEVVKNDDEFNTDPTQAKSKHLTLNMVDWNPPSPDRYTGLQYAPELVQDGPVSVRDAHVVQANAKDLSSSDLTLKAQLRNNTDVAQRITVFGTVSRHRTEIDCKARVTVPANATKPIAITPADCPGLHVVRPAVWWPYQMGDQPLYRFALQASVHGERSDGFSHDFGIRTVTSSLTPVVPGKTHGQYGWRKFAINGVPFVVRGAAWSQDMFLRYSPRTVAEQLSYVKNMNLNTIRFEGNFPPDDMLDQMDRAGILAMPGYQCCDHWEDFISTWAPELRANAANQTARMARQLRTHPSVFTFFLGSDYAPDPEKEAIYLDAFRAADWETPLVPNAWYRSSAQLGPSGTKEGSYNYTPPIYWWSNGPETVNTAFGPDLPFLFDGNAWGFETEASAGNTIPTQDSLDRFLTQADQKKVWDPVTANGPGSGEDIFHTTVYTPYHKLGRMGVYNTALWNRYGHWSDMASYQRVAQLGQYEVARAQFEAYIGHADDPANPTTGVIYWMLNKAWPSLMWSLFGTDFDQPGVYFGAKKANEPVHILYAYDDGSIKVANQTNAPQPGLRATVELIDLDGTVRSTSTVAVPTLASQDLQTVARPQVPANISQTYFARLTLARGTSVVSRNVYWLSTKPDRIDWASTHGNFQSHAAFEPDGYADLTGLQKLGSAQVKAVAATRREGDEVVMAVTIRNVSAGGTPVVSARADVFAGRREVLPIRWSDNQITLWPGEQQTITAHYEADALRGGRPAVRLTAFNLASQTVDAG